MGNQMSNAGRNVQMLRLVSVPGIGHRASGIRNVEFVRLVFVSGIGYPSQHFHLHKSETEMMRSLVLKMMRAMSFISRQASILNFHVKPSALTTAAYLLLNIYVGQKELYCSSLKPTSVVHILVIFVLFNSLTNIRWIYLLNQISPRQSKPCWARHNDGGRPLTKVRWPWWIITGVVRKLKQCTTVKRHVNTERFGVSRRTQTVFTFRAVF